MYLSSHPHPVRHRLLLQVEVCVVRVEPRRLVGRAPGPKVEEEAGGLAKELGADAPGVRVEAAKHVAGLGNVCF